MSQQNLGSELVFILTRINSQGIVAVIFVGGDKTTAGNDPKVPNGANNQNIWQISRVPLSDVNGNGELDVEDLCILEQSNPMSVR